MSRPGEPAGEELSVQVGFVESEKIQLHDGRYGSLPQAQGIQVRNLVPAQTVDLYQARHRSLLFARLLRGRTALPADTGGNGERLLWPRLHIINNRTFGHFASGLLAGHTATDRAVGYVPSGWLAVCFANHPAM